MCLYSITRACSGGTTGVFSPPQSLELAGTFPGVVGEGEGLQAVKGEAGRQLVQAIVLQMDMFQRGHTQEGTIRELGREVGTSEHPSPCPASPISMAPEEQGPSLDVSSGTLRSFTV